MRLLLVEDDCSTAQRLLQSLLQIDNDYDITHVTTVASAMSELHASSAYDVALVDLCLPDAQSFEAPASLCESFPDLVVVALTGETDTALAAEIIRLGAQDFLQKGANGPIAVDRALRCALERHRRELCLKDAATDELTGALNRRGCRAVLQMRAEEYGNHHDGNLALLTLDLDGFKAINDNHGHTGGDIVLRICAARISRCLRPEDRVARIGGDEFAIICDLAGCSAGVASIAQKLLQHVGAPYSLGESRVYISASIGIACLPEDAQSIDQLIHRSDMALYAAKRRGKNRYVFYNNCTDESRPQAATSDYAPACPPGSIHPMDTEAGQPQLRRIAHDLCNELNLVALEADVIQLGVGEGDYLQVDQSVTRIREKCLAMANLISQIR